MEHHFIFLTIGSVLLAGMCADVVSRHTNLPRVSLMIVLGAIAGPSGLSLLPEAYSDWYEILASAALTIVAFLLGGQLSLDNLRQNGRMILTVSVTVVILTGATVFVGLVLCGVSVILALVLAGIATATDPAATQDVVRQTKAKGPFTDTLLGIVAIDDAWGLIVFSLLLMVAKAILGDGGVTILHESLADIGGAIAIGAVIGIPAAFLSGRLSKGEPTQAEAIGIVFLCAGLAIWLEVSYLLAGIVAGALIVNFAKHHTRPFHEIKHIEWPFMVIFFVFAGASLDLSGLKAIGLIGLAFLGLRALGRFVGGWVGGVLAQAPVLQRRWMGLALMPQAGVALGMALIAANEFPAHADAILAAAIGSTIIFELFGPMVTQVALKRVGESR